jgi:hypothetical protein
VEVIGMNTESFTVPLDGGEMSVEIGPEGLEYESWLRRDDGERMKLTRRLDWADVERLRDLLGLPSVPGYIRINPAVMEYREATRRGDFEAALAAAGKAGLAQAPVRAVELIDDGVDGREWHDMLRIDHRDGDWTDEQYEALCDAKVESSRRAWRVRERGLRRGLLEAIKERWPDLQGFSGYLSEHSLGSSFAL